MSVVDDSIDEKIKGNLKDGRIHNVANTADKEFRHSVDLDCSTATRLRKHTYLTLQVTKSDTDALADKAQIFSDLQNAINQSFQKRTDDIEATLNDAASVIRSERDFTRSKKLIEVAKNQKLDGGMAQPTKNAVRSLLTDMKNSLDGVPAAVLQRSHVVILINNLKDLADTRGNEVTAETFDVNNVASAIGIQ